MAEHVSGPAWSPDGDSIAGLASPEGRQQHSIVTFAPDGSERRTLFDLGQDFSVGERVGWAPGGGAIAFTASSYTGWHTPVPFPVFGTGIRCGEPMGGGGLGATRTVTDGADMITGMIYSCESRTGDIMEMHFAVTANTGYLTSAHLDVDDGTSLESAGVAALSCSNRGSTPFQPNVPWQNPAGLGEHTLTFTVRIVSCEAAHLGEVKTFSLSMPYYRT